MPKYSALNRRLNAIRTIFRPSYREIKLNERLPVVFLSMQKNQFILFAFLVIIVMFLLKFQLCTNTFVYFPSLERKYSASYSIQAHKVKS